MSNEEFYKELAMLHDKYFPHQRPLQLMSNFFGWLVNEKGIDPFFPTKEKTLKLLEEYGQCENIFHLRYNIKKGDDF